MTQSPATIMQSVDRQPVDQPAVPGRRRVRGGILIHDDHAPADLLNDLERDADVMLRSGAMLKDGDRCTVARLDLPSGPVVVKRYNLRGPLHTAVHWFMRSRARWSWRNGRRLMRLGVRTPRPMAVLERRIGPLRSRSYLALQFVAGSALDEYIGRHRHDAPRLDRLAASMGELWDTLGGARISCGDLKASNLIVDDDEHVWLIDLDGLRVHRVGVLWARERRRDMDSFMRNWADDPAAAELFKRRVRP